MELQKFEKDHFRDSISLGPCWGKKRDLINMYRRRLKWVP